MLPQVFLFLLIHWSHVEGSNAFTMIPSATFQRTTTESLPFALRGGAIDNNDDDDDNDDDMNPINQGKLVSTLAKLDREWNIQQASPSSRRNNSKLNRWTKLELTNDDDDTTADTDTDTMDENEEMMIKPKDFVYLLEPKMTTTPSCMILFLGGAGLGQYPHIAYDEFLFELSNKLSATVICAPYSIGLNHFDLAKQSGELLRRGKNDYSQTNLQNANPNLPVFVLGHSLGCKLLTIYLAATTEASLGTNLNGIGFISFNNYSFSNTITMARELADRLLSKSSSAGSSGSTLMNSVLDFASQAVTMMGLEFTPSPSDMKRLIELKYDEAMTRKTRLFTLTEDSLDTTDDFVTSLSDTTVAVSKSPGNHLTPVYLSFNLNDYMDGMESSIPPEVMTGGFKGASFGNQQDMNDLVQQVVNFCLGKPVDDSGNEPLLLQPSSSSSNDEE